MVEFQTHASGIEKADIRSYLGLGLPLTNLHLPDFIVGSLGAASKVGAMLLDLILWWGHLIIKTDLYRNGRIPDPCFRN